MSRIHSFEYANMNWITYGEEQAMFIPVCPKCRCFVKADKEIMFNGLGEIVEQPNATCKKCGRVEMPFMGFL